MMASLKESLKGEPAIKPRPLEAFVIVDISDHQQSWGYEDGSWKGPGPPLLVAADF